MDCAEQSPERGDLRAGPAAAPRRGGAARRRAVGLSDESSRVRADRAAAPQVLTAEGHLRLVALQSGGAPADESLRVSRPVGLAECTLHGPAAPSGACAGGADLRRPILDSITGPLSRKPLHLGRRSVQFGQQWSSM